ncbi:MAG: hypothetical protein Kow0047_18910 [Anaerolineae bacterium]
MTTGEQRLSAVSGGPLIAVDVWLGRPLFSMSALWAVIAGALITLPAGSSLSDLGRQLVLAVLLADVLWGNLWAVLTTRDGLTLRRGYPLIRLPYLRPESPAAHLLGWSVNGGDGAVSWQAIVLLAILAAIISALIGVPAMALSAAALLACLIGWALDRSGGHYWARWMQALVEFGFPWMLGAWAVSGRMELWWLGMTFCVWYRAGLARGSGERTADLLLLVSQVLALAALIWLRSPISAVFVALGIIVPWWQAARADGQWTTAHGQGWWWIALMGSALALAV